MRIAIVACLVAASCGGEKKEPKPQPATPAPAVPSDAAAAAAPPSKPAPAPPPTAEQREAYRKHLRKGRALGKQSDWKAAATELEAALAAIPNDGRALSELGWVAFQAGDYQRAATANAESVKYAADDNVAAASLYNLGRVAEATGDPAQAARHYQQSLRLRPGNKIVTKALANVGAKPPKVGEFEGAVDSCTEPMTADALCACRGKEYEELSEEGHYSCDVTVSPVAEVGLLEMEFTEGYERFVAVDLVRREPGDKWRAVAALGDGYGGRGHTEDYEVVRVAKRSAGPREILWVEITWNVADAWWDSDIEWERSTTQVVLYSMPDARCKYSFPVAGSRSSTPVDEEREPTGETESSEYRAELSLSADGKATLTMVAGKREELAGFLGTHQLW